ncbi:PQQ-dependent sugar dehydrogenase [Streptomyces profundus]|uniref:PQQ-dependent sugar dehydrogenase n=1 Tax=Streptomyces profundus TaxID=2867410 RepID=UPI001D1650FD|nr:PQQ-dependent sugar dehydrogenase [Streptomyces sp. MA3_2.13]UED84915.1 PQQ-dependent sugar dehydrogenase [Streptomyces sp. MA3_2.13]
MRERGARQRLLRRALVAVAAGGALLAGCVGGPAADRAAREPATPADDEASNGGEGEADDERPGASPPPQEPLPTAEPTGSAQRIASLPEQAVPGWADACCLAEFPDGDLLVGTSAGALSRVTPEGEVTEVGQLSGALEAGTGELLALAISPGFVGDGRPSDELYAFYAGAGSSAVAAYGHDPAGAEGSQVNSANRQVVRDLPRAESRNGGALAFGPDGLLYLGLGDTGSATLAADPESEAGKILRMEPNGGPPDDGANVAIGSLVHTLGHGDIRGLAWDEQDRLWSVEIDPEGVVEVNAVIPGERYDQQPPEHSWESGEVDPVGLAYDAVSLWVPSRVGEGLWRLPLDLAHASRSAEPQPLGEELTGPSAVLPGAAEGRLRVLVTGAGGGAVEEYAVD